MKLIGICRSHIHLDRGVLVELGIITELASLAMGDIKTQIGYGLLNQGLGLEYFQFVIEEAGEVDGGQLHDIGQRGAGLAPVIVLFLNQDFRTAAIHRSAVSDIHIGAAQTEDDTDYKPGPVGQVLEKDFVKIEFLFGLLSSSLEGGVLLGHIK
jgi:hypothetical protein